MSVSPLDKEAGGWRWAILVVSIVILLEVLLAVSSGAAKSSASSWPHTGVLLVLTVANLFLTLAAFISLPYGGTPTGYLIVTRGCRCLSWARCRARRMRRRRLGVSQEFPERRFSPTGRPALTCRPAQFAHRKRGNDTPEWLNNAALSPSASNPE